MQAYKLSVWYSRFGLVGIPKELVDRLNIATNQALADAALRSRMDAIGVEAIAETPQEFAVVLRRDAKRYDGITRDLSIKNE